MTDISRYSLIELDEVDSTNDYAKNMAKNGADHETVIIAKKQTAGKGRMGRSFISDKENGIYMSIILRPGIEPELVSRLTLVAAVAVRRAIFNTCHMELGIKWPNDVIVNGKKVCGILTEMSADEDGVRYVVAGIGVNVTDEAFGEDIKDVATSLRMITGRKYDSTEIKRIRDAILSEFAKYYDIYIREKNLSSIKDEYEQYLINSNKPVNVINGNQVLQGICRGIGDEGELLIENEDGFHKIISGEVSVRGVYGYV